ncbi:alpha-L-rhamnosidase C-terminal domain-containing protein [Cohnella sp. GCM10020058]|uniref:alpha-L-rhamnosidase-related protein n=1 Tax=Cohnella sp. GCM10020058 TaxID=3317330 RepID=UPI003633A92A
MEELREWRACWIWPESLREDSEGGTRQQRALFRREFQVPEEGAGLKLDVSADSKFRLYLNGNLIARGPIKGDAWAQYYDTLDVGDKLVPGANVLAAEVVHYPRLASVPGAEVGPASEGRADYGGLWIQGALEDEAGRELTRLDSDDHWRALPLRAVRIGPEIGTLFVGGTEEVRGDMLPAGWREAGFDDASWERPVATEPLDRLYGQVSPWQLAANPIPRMRETPRAFARVIRSEDLQAAQGVPDGAASGGDAAEALPFPLKLAPGHSAWAELDAGLMTTGYVRLAVAGGAGARISLLYSEAYEYENPADHGGNRRGVRDDPADKVLRGNEDVYLPVGAGTPDDPEVYEPMGRRAFRFVRLSVQAADAPLTIVDLSYAETGYPLDAVSQVETSDPLSGELWNISLNTLRRCMQDTYEDTPYYEQMQYVMDAKSQALFTYAVSADDRLARKTIHDFHSSLTPSGLIQSRYPSVNGQFIPGFALYWVMMVHDHYRHFGDTALVRRYLSTADAILGWFDRRIGKDGLVGPMPEAYWSFVDWVTAWNATAGAPPAKLQGPLTVYNLMYASALREAADLNAWSGRGDTAAEYRQRAEAVLVAVRRSCLDEAEQLYRDGPQVAQFSQHTQIWAVLADAVQGGEARELLARMLARNDLPKASFSMAHYLFRAAAKTGLYGYADAFWQPWREQVGLHLTAWVEDPVQQRSDCHGWGALPLYEYVAETLGVQPEEPGYRTVRIAPRTGGLTWASGEAKTPAGLVKVSWKLNETNGGTRFALSGEAPEGVPVVVVLPDGTRHVPSGPVFEYECSVEEGATA